MEKRNARGKMGRGREDPAFSLFLSSPPALAISRSLLFFYWDTVREALRRREDIYEHSRLHALKKRLIS